MLLCVAVCRDQGEKMAYADDVLLPKVELDEKKQRIVELEGQVCWLTNHSAG